MKTRNITRKDKKNVVFQKIDNADKISYYLELQRKVNFLERIAKEYPEKTINYIIEQIKTKMSEY